MKTAFLRRRRHGWRHAVLVLLAAVGVVTPNTVLAEVLTAEQRNAELAKLMDLARQQRLPVKPLQLTLDVAQLPALGQSRAPVTVVEFSTLQCPFCRRHAQHTMPALLERVDRGEINYVIHDFPVQTEQHELVEAVLCAAEQDKYFDLRKQLLADPAAGLDATVARSGLDAAQLSDCMESDRQHKALDQLLSTGRELGIRGTPTFLIGRAQQGAGLIEVSTRIDGAQPYRVFATEIDALLHPQ